MLQEREIIPNDNIRHITSSGQIELVPITDEEQRKMVFVIEKEERPEILRHIMYGGCGEGLPFKLSSGDLKTGDVYVSEDLNMMIIGIHKRSGVIFGAVTETLNKVYWQCIRLNKGLQISTELQQISGFNDVVNEVLVRRGIPVSYE